jgi:hypothetical protein
MRHDAGHSPAGLRPEGKALDDTDKRRSFTRMS